MPGQGQNRWVVLLNRSPKGPLTEEEVKTLLERGILRANDIAYQVSEEEKGKSEWKLLWQFPEFNRRQPGAAAPEDKSDEAPRSTTAPGGKDRRQKTPPEEIQKKAVAELPPDLMDISPADLLPRSTAVQFKPEPAQITPVSDDTLLQDKPENRSSGFQFDSRWIFAAGAVGMLVFAVVKLPSLFHGVAEKTYRAPTGRANIDALQPGDTVPVGHAPQPSQVTVHPAKKMPSRPIPQPQARDNAQESPSRFDEPAPPEPAPEEERAEEMPFSEGATEDINTANSSTNNGMKRKDFRPRQPTTEEEGSGSNGPAVESMPADQEGGPAAPSPEVEEQPADGGSTN